jgi:DNA-3-methyladenine glycosylase II
MARHRKTRPRRAQRLIESEADIRDGVRALTRACPAMRRLHGIVGEPPLRRMAGGFEGLARIVVAQQLSAGSAAAIWQRTAALVNPFEPRVLMRYTEAELNRAGLSEAKTRTLLALSEAIDSRALSLERLGMASEEDIHAALSAVRGIGPWTASIYQLFCLGRADAWAAGDLALQTATREALALRDKPDARALEAIADRWRPWRGVAARLLWAWYAHPDFKLRSKPKARS